MNFARFFGMAAEAMRRILIDHARKRGAKKRGGPNLNKLSLDVAEVAATADLSEVMAIDEAITALADVNSRAAEIVRAGGLVVEGSTKQQGAAHVFDITDGNGTVQVIFEGVVTGFFDDFLDVLGHL